MQAIARTAFKREGIGINLDNWELSIYEDAMAISSSLPYARTVRNH